MSQKVKAGNLYEWLDLICNSQRVAMYIGEKSVTALYFHIDGYESACQLKGIDEKLSPDFRNFNEFVASYFETESAPGWRLIILNNCNGDESAATDEFFRLLQLFRQATPC